MPAAERDHDGFLFNFLLAAERGRKTRSEVEYLSYAVPAKREIDIDRQRKREKREKDLKKKKEKERERDRRIDARSA